MDLIWRYPPIWNWWPSLDKDLNACVHETSGLKNNDNETKTVNDFIVWRMSDMMFLLHYSFPAMIKYFVFFKKTNKKLVNKKEKYNYLKFIQ